mmetsp:Transcript_158045/g.506949  ORF Transcript_158045/g.506949 Transcript_158045/m.506949 type:complete len:220 (+) Transcript_158045:260-919(+)
MLSRRMLACPETVQSQSAAHCRQPHLPALYDLNGCGGAKLVFASLPKVLPSYAASFASVTPSHILGSHDSTDARLACVSDQLWHCVMRGEQCIRTYLLRPRLLKPETLTIGKCLARQGRCLMFPGCSPRCGRASRKACAVRCSWTFPADHDLKVALVITGHHLPDVASTVLDVDAAKCSSLFSPLLWLIYPCGPSVDFSRRCSWRRCLASAAARHFAHP